MKKKKLFLLYEFFTMSSIESIVSKGEIILFSCDAKNWQERAALFAELEVCLNTQVILEIENNSFFAQF